MSHSKSITALEYTSKHIARKLNDWCPLIKFSIGAISDGSEAPLFLEMMLKQQGWDVLRLDFNRIENLDLFKADENGTIDFDKEIRECIEQLTEQAAMLAKPIVIVSRLDLLLTDYYQPFVDLVKDGFRLPLKNSDSDVNDNNNPQLFAPVFFTTRSSFGNAMDQALCYDFLHLDKYSIRENRFVMKFFNDYEQNLDNEKHAQLIQQESITTENASNHQKIKY
jgi:hypothetical protein